MKIKNDVVQCVRCGGKNTFQSSSPVETVNDEEYAIVTQYWCEDCNMPFMSKSKVQKRDPTKPEEVDMSGQVWKKNVKK